MRTHFWYPFSGPQNRTKRLIKNAAVRKKTRDNRRLRLQTADPTPTKGNPGHQRFRDDDAAAEQTRSSLSRFHILFSTVSGESVRKFPKRKEIRVAIRRRSEGMRADSASTHAHKQPFLIQVAREPCADIVSARAPKENRRHRQAPSTRTHLESVGVPRTASAYSSQAPAEQDALFAPTSHRKTRWHWKAMALRTKQILGSSFWVRFLARKRFPKVEVTQSVSTFCAIFWGRILTPKTGPPKCVIVARATCMSPHCFSGQCVLHTQHCCRRQCLYKLLSLVQPKIITRACHTNSVDD